MDTDELRSEDMRISKSYYNLIIKKSLLEVGGNFVATIGVKNITLDCIYLDSNMIKL